MVKHLLLFQQKCWWFLYRANSNLLLKKLKPSPKSPAMAICWSFTDYINKPPSVMSTPPSPVSSALRKEQSGMLGTKTRARPRKLLKVNMLLLLKDFWAELFKRFYYLNMNECTRGEMNVFCFSIECIIWNINPQVLNSCIRVNTLWIKNTFHIKKKKKFLCDFLQN